MNGVPAKRLVVLALALGLTDVLLAQTPGRQAGSTNQPEAYTYSHLYLFGRNGDFLGVDLEAGSVEAMWNLARVAGLEHVFPTPNPPLVEQGWTFRPFRVSSNGRRIFGIVEAAGGLGDLQTGDVYQLVELELPNMKLIQNAALPGRGA